MDALILAGGGCSPELAQATGRDERALIEVGERAMVVRVLEVLRATAGIERVAVVGSERVLDKCSAFSDHIVRVKSADKMTQNFARGVGALKENSPANAQVLVCTCDIPLVSSGTFEQLMQSATRDHLELAYPIVRRSLCEAAFPGGKRTYVQLRDGEFTGGNALVVPLRIVDNINALLESAYNARKNPLGLAKLLGPNFLWKFVRKQLSIRDVEERARRVLDCRVGAVQMSDPTIAFDVDKVSDWQQAVQYQEKTRL
ncbi:MAG TPA: nucleotidyltransferase family protein [Abditibacteriaceae bacterium]|jgi:GTP:adenosylcobinamide-phosphate guanylyltransferase|nr:nucleotidyltransferase family protein [Abditibacteriaceae bacterium]